MSDRPNEHRLDRFELEHRDPTRQLAVLAVAGETPILRILVFETALRSIITRVVYLHSSLMVSCEPTTGQGWCYDLPLWTWNTASHVLLLFHDSPLLHFVPSFPFYVRSSSYGKPTGSL